MLIHPSAIILPETCMAHHIIVAVFTFTFYPIHNDGIKSHSVITRA